MKLVKQLKNKDTYYLKLDKSNAFVIIDRKVHEKLKGCVKLKAHRLPDSIKRVERY